MLKISAIYLEKQKSFIPKKYSLAVVSKYVKIDPKDGASCLDFQWRFCVSLCSILPDIFMFLYVNFVELFVHWLACNVCFHLHGHMAG